MSIYKQFLYVNSLRYKVYVLSMYLIQKFKKAIALWSCFNDSQKSVQCFYHLLAFS